MQLSRYCRIFGDPTDSERSILFSTKSAAKIAVPKSFIREISTAHLAYAEERNLAELGFLVKDDMEDREQILSFIDEINALNTFTFFKIVMNLNCNLACRYCFEGTRKGSHYLSDKDSDLVVSFIKEQSVAHTEIRVTFYGGEPLLSLDCIAMISAALQTHASENGKTYGASLVTNGTLLTPRVMERLIPLGVKSASITIDGPQNVHDSSRPFRNGEGSYEKILRNLKDVSGMVEVQIGGNYTRNNYRRFPELLDDLISEGLTPELIPSVQFYPVIQEAAGVVEHGFCEGCASLNEPWIYDAEPLLREELLGRGYRPLKITPIVCMMDLKGRTVINYDGSLYKCAGLIGREEFKIGDLRSGIRHMVSQGEGGWKNEQCLDCAYLPLCFGGCRYMKFVRDGNMDGVDCRKAYFDATLEAFVKQDIKYGLTG